MTRQAADAMQSTGLCEGDTVADWMDIVEYFFRRIVLRQHPRLIRRLSVLSEPFKISSFNIRYGPLAQAPDILKSCGTPQLTWVVSTGAILTTSLSLWIAKAFGPITVKALGLDIDVLSPDGHPLEAGQMGELIKRSTSKLISLRYHSDVWTHGDLIKIDPRTNGLIILGRSDGVLNPSGVRFGSSEIYAVLANHFSASVKDSLCVGQQRHDKDLHERVILFVHFSSSHTEPSSSQLKCRIRRKIAEDLSRRHVPHFIFEVKFIPYNANGKKMETQVKSILNGGNEALLSMKVSDAEKAALEPFVKFFNIENLSSQSKDSRDNSESTVAKL
ncbi:acetoacetate- ligase [Trichoderma arundinaceum]|uniref:Acetoacetate-ligase n=1 Tax=Trichoderma arundinaceum TaxID=490622 RepID=A0A395NLX3_TRIAR|nr:acetoacetate- ligase [Trichoderma arundinaceum]